MLRYACADDAAMPPDERHCAGDADIYADIYTPDDADTGAPMSFIDAMPPFIFSPAPTPMRLFMSHAAPF